jgi:predicted DNA-binding transcriptional regulator AlpA
MAYRDPSVHPGSGTVPPGTVPPALNPLDPDKVPRLLWGWPEVLQATGLPRRTLERELAKGAFPKPVRRVGRRPYWKPTDVQGWTQGEGD